MTGGRPGPGEPRPLPFDLGDEVRFDGMLWRVDDEALIGLEGQGDLLWGQFDPELLEPVRRDAPGSHHRARRRD